MVAIAAMLEDNAGIPLITISGEDETEHRGVSQIDLKQLKNRGSLLRGHSNPTDDPHALLMGDSEGGSSTNPSQHGSLQFLEQQQQQQQQQGDPTPQFFQSTKFFAVLEQEEATELFNKTLRRHLKPGQ